MMHLCIFDVDGTLTKSNSLDDRCFAQAVSDVLGIPRISTNWLEYQFQTDSGLAQEICRKHLGRSLQNKEAVELQRRFMQLLEGAQAAEGPVGEVPGAGALLRELREQSDWQIAIATGGWKQSALWKLEQAGLDARGIALASADDAHDRVEILRLALHRAVELYQQHAQTIVYVGDGLWDLRASVQVDVGFIGVAEGEQADRLREAGARFIFANFVASQQFQQAVRNFSTNSSTCRL